ICLAAEARDILKYGIEHLVGERLQHKATGTAFHREGTVLFAGNHIDRNMPVIKVVSQQVNYLPTTCVRKLYIERNRNRGETVDEIEYLQVIDGNHRFQIVFMRLVHDDLAEPQVVFHNK